MKKILLALSLISVICLTAMRCDDKETTTCHPYIKFCNGSDTTYYVEWNSTYPDTVPPAHGHLHEFSEVSSHKLNSHALYGGSCFESNMGKNGLITVFVYNADSVWLYGDDFFSGDHRITQRYYLSEDDLYTLDWTLTFPPDVHMKNIKMWPAYGTYGQYGGIEE